MDLRAFLFLTASVISVSGQFYPSSLINQTQHLQDIEKYGPNYTGGSFNLYPTVNNLTNSTGNGSNFGQRLNTTAGGRPNHDAFNQTSGSSRESFVNRTMSNMPKGICTKEVPTASLLKYLDQVIVPGNGSDPSLSRIQVCCEGYRQNAHIVRECDPICRKNCDNGICTAPDTCACFPDFVKNLDDDCIATCPSSCANGICSPDNSCRCNEGFQLENGGKFCIPRCSNGCANGECTGPETCTCNKGYALSPEGKCEAVCSKGCKHGDCVAPEVCKCKNGYEKKEGYCTPICSSGCQDGVCFAPEVCRCNEGWSLNAEGNKCTAACDKPCLNGICSGRNKCSCKTGYAQDNFDVFRCVPRCDPPCINGVCSGPNFCLCYAGYVKDRTSSSGQKCVKA